MVPPPGSLLSSVVMQHKDARTRFDYENRGRLHGDLARASWLIDQTAWALCPLIPIPDPEREQRIQQAQATWTTAEAEQATREWLRSSPHGFRALNHPHATFTSTVEGVINSYIQRSPGVANVRHTWYHVRDASAVMGKPHAHLGDDPESHWVIIELPNPQNSVEHTVSLMERAHSRGQRVAVDLTYLPVSTQSISHTLSMADEVWVSMNKAYRTGDLRPAWRFSREPVPDGLTLSHQRGTYNRTSMKAWRHIIENNQIDEVSRRHMSTYRSVCDRFDLGETNNILAARKPGVVWEPMYTPNWNYNDLIGTHNLIAQAGKHFW